MVGLPEHRQDRTTVTEAEHPVDRFLRWVDEIPPERYPDQLVPVAGRHVDGVAGFPAGRGLYAPCGWDHAEPPPFPFGGLMLVGNHLDAEDAYVEKRAAGAANGDPCPGATRMRFWSILYRLLDEAGIPRDRIFVTNVHPALISGRTATGTIAPDRAWLETCEDLLRRQIDVMRPSVIAAMGVPARQFVERLAGVPLGNAPAIVQTDVQGRDTHVAAMRHPSAAQRVEMRRRTGQLLADAMRDAGGLVGPPDSRA